MVVEIHDNQNSIKPTYHGHFVSSQKQHRSASIISDSTAQRTASLNIPHNYTLRFETAFNPPQNSRISNGKSNLPVYVDLFHFCEGISHTPNIGHQEYWIDEQVVAWPRSDWLSSDCCMAKLDVRRWDSSDFKVLSYLANFNLTALDMCLKFLSAVSNDNLYRTLSCAIRASIVPICTPLRRLLLRMSAASI